MPAHRFLFGASQIEEKLHEVCARRAINAYAASVQEGNLTADRQAKTSALGILIGPTEKRLEHPHLLRFVEGAPVIHHAESYKTVIARPYAQHYRPVRQAVL